MIKTKEKCRFDIEKTFMHNITRDKGYIPNIV